MITLSNIIAFLATTILLSARKSMSFRVGCCRYRPSLGLMNAACDIESFMIETMEDTKAPSILQLSGQKQRNEWKPSKPGSKINKSLFPEESEEVQHATTLHYSSTAKRTEWKPSQPNSKSKSNQFTSVKYEDSKEKIGSTISKQPVIQKRKEWKRQTTEHVASAPTTHVQQFQLKNYTSTSWTPAAAYISNNQNINSVNLSGERNRPVMESSVEKLQRPMLYVKYRVPRRMTEIKRSLLANQDIFQKRPNDLSLPPFETTKPRAGRVSLRDSPDSPRHRTAISTGKKKGHEQTLTNRKRSGIPVKSSYRDESENDMDILGDANDIIFSEDGEDYEDFELETEVDEVVHLSDVDDAEILQLVNDDLELSEIMSILATKYGIRASFKDLRARISEAKSETSRRRKTGKTRRDRKKDFIAKTSTMLNPSNIVKLSAEPTISIKTLAELMGFTTGEILKYLMVNEGMLININQSIEREMAEKVITAFGKTIEHEDELEALEKQLKALEIAESSDSNDDVDGGDSVLSLPVSRAPVVTIMGHVDHGKTSLLDKIRKSRVAQTEAGGITQAISAFRVPIESLPGQEGTKSGAITFIDTPGHAAFSEMRKRGAKMTDIVVLVIAADDGIMEQTRECIQAAKVAKCPIVVAINKVDKVGANPDKVKQDLLNEGMLVEEYGGEVQVATVSAKTGEGIDDLLEKILLQAEVMSLEARPDGDVEGTVVEGSIDKRLGVVVTALVQQGTLKVGQFLVCGTSYGKIRRLLNDKGESITEAGPSTPVRIIGMNRVPDAGDSIVQTHSDTLAKEMSEARLRFMKDTSHIAHSNAIREQGSVGLINGTVDRRERLTIPVVIKADVAGSLEALIASLSKIVVEDNNAVCKVDVVYSGVGDVSSSDVSIAASAKAHVVAFNVAATLFGQEESRSKNVEIQYYTVLYDVLNDMQKLVDTTITPPAPGESLGKAVIKKIFTIGRTGKVAGCLVESGQIVRNAQIRVLRGKTQVFVGMLANLKVIKDEQEVVVAGKECGMTLRGFEDFLEGDVIECFQVVSDDHE